MASKTLASRWTMILRPRARMRHMATPHLCRLQAIHVTAWSAWPSAGHVLSSLPDRGGHRVGFDQVRPTRLGSSAMARRVWPCGIGGSRGVGMVPQMEALVKLQWVRRCIVHTAAYPPLHHILTGKDFPRFFIPPAARELRIDHGVSDRGVPNPILHKAEVCAGVQQVRSNRVFEGVEMP